LAHKVHEGIPMKYKLTEEYHPYGTHTHTHTHTHTLACSWKERIETWKDSIHYYR